MSVSSISRCRLTPTMLTTHASGLAFGPLDGTPGESSDQYAIEHNDAAELSGRRPRFGRESDVVWKSRLLEFDLWHLRQ
jgi:hypothetical protein